MRRRRETLCSSEIANEMRFPANNGYSPTSCGTVYQADSSATFDSSNPSRAGRGGAQTSPTVPINLRRGQVVKHHILWVTRPKRSILQLLCNSCALKGFALEWRGRESESQISLARRSRECNGETRKQAESIEPRAESQKCYSRSWPW